MAEVAKTKSKHSEGGAPSGACGGGEAEAEDPNEEEYAGEGEEEEEMALDREIEAQNHWNPFPILFHIPWKSWKSHSNADSSKQITIHCRTFWWAELWIPVPAACNAGKFWSCVGPESRRRGVQKRWWKIVNQLGMENIGQTLAWCWKHFQWNLAKSCETFRNIMTQGFAHMTNSAVMSKMDSKLAPSIMGLSSEFCLLSVFDLNLRQSLPRRYHMASSGWAAQWLWIPNEIWKWSYTRLWTSRWRFKSWCPADVGIQLFRASYSWVFRCISGWNYVWSVQCNRSSIARVVMQRRVLLLFGANRCSDHFQVAPQRGLMRSCLAVVKKSLFTSFCMAVHGAKQYKALFANAW